MKTAIVIVIGATGLVGKKTTEQLLKNDDYSAVIILVRKLISIGHPKPKQQVFNYDTPDDSIVKGDDLYCCLGSTIKKAGGKEAFYKVDFNYVVSLAKIAKENGTTQLAAISAMGANKNSTLFYNKTKGEMEEAIKFIGFDSTYTVRPSMLPGNRDEIRFGELVGKFFMTAMSFLISKKYKAIYDVQVAKTTIYFMSKRQKGFYIKENNELLDVK